MARKFLDLITEVEKLIESEPSVPAVRRYVELVENAVVREHAFGRLSRADWLNPLRGAGLFREVPKPVQEDGGTRLPGWPEGDYLVRIASSAPKDVCATVLSLPVTENVWALRRFLLIAIELPADVAADLIPLLRERLSLKWQWAHGDEVAKLVNRLAEGGFPAPAVDLFQDFLVLVPAKEEWGNPGAKIREFEYELVLQRTKETLEKVLGDGLLDVLCKILEKGLPEDRISFGWRSAIEEHEQNHRTGPRSLLVDTIRDVSLSLVASKRVTAEALAGRLTARGRSIFVRIALHLVAEVGPVDTAKTWIRKKELFEDAEYRHEYMRLARLRLGEVDAESQALLLSWIDAGPSLSKYVENWKREGSDPTEEELKQFVRRWQRDWLTPIRDHLDTTWKYRLEKFEEELGVADHPDFLMYSTGGWVSDSKDSEFQFEKMTASEIAALLKEWKPRRERFGTSNLDVSQQLSSAVAASPERFQADVPSLLSLPPRFASGVISGFRSALKQGRPLKWEPVLELCHSVSSVAEKGSSDVGWAKKTVADLLGDGFESRDSGIPIALRKIAWSALAPCLDSEDPTPSREEKGGDRDFATLSINSTRGEALHSTIRYAMWVRRSFEGAADERERNAKGFDEMPEVRETLEKHLDPEKDPSLAVRAVYGWWFPWLQLIDPKWSASNAAVIFPAGGEQHSFRDAAWRTYLTFCSPYDDVFAILHDEYASAVDRLSPTADDDRRRSHERLAEHLMVLFWRGKLGAPGDETILKRFFEKAPPTLRSHGIGFVGRSLVHRANESKTPTTIPTEIVNRLESLWDWRLKVLEHADSEQRSELAEFGWWIRAEIFPTEKMLLRLKATLALAGRIEPLDSVAEYLEELVSSHPEEVLACTKLLTRDSDPFAVHLWRNHVRKILTVVPSKSPGLRDQVADFVHELGERGHLEFRDLLSM